MSSTDFINLLVYRGNDTSIAVNFKTQDDDPIDITGWTLTLIIKNKLYQVEEEDIIKIDVTSHLDAINGRTGIFIAHALTQTLSGVFYYEIKYRTNNDIIKTFATGNIEFMDDR